MKFRLHETDNGVARLLSNPGILFKKPYGFLCFCGSKAVKQIGAVHFLKRPGVMISLESAVASLLATVNESAAKIDREMIIFQEQVALKRKYVTELGDKVQEVFGGGTDFRTLSS